MWKKLSLEQGLMSKGAEKILAFEERFVLLKRNRNQWIKNRKEKDKKTNKQKEELKAWRL